MRNEHQISYSHNIRGRVSSESFVILTMSQTRMYTGQTMSVDELLDPPPFAFLFITVLKGLRNGVVPAEAEWLGP